MDRRLHIGLIIPANNTTMERGLLAWLPEQSVGSCDGLLTYDILEPLQSAFWEAGDVFNPGNCARGGNEGGGGTAVC